MDQKGKWTLAPAYDICFAYNSANQWVSKHALSINFKREHFTMDDFMSVARLINCRKPETIIAKVKETVSHWSDFAAQAHVDDDLYRMIQESILVDVDD